ncbi:hypothetical protein Tco_1264357 [Tanacetum coccineum]
MRSTARGGDWGEGGGWSRGNRVYRALRGTRGFEVEGRVGGKSVEGIVGGGEDGGEGGGARGAEWWRRAGGGGEVWWYGVLGEGYKDLDMWVESSCSGVGNPACWALDGTPFEDRSDIGSPGVDGPPIMPEDPYAYIMAAYQAPPSPDYMHGPEEP